MRCFIHSICRERMLHNESGINLRYSGNDVRIAYEIHKRRASRRKKRKRNTSRICRIIVIEHEKVFAAHVNHFKLNMNEVFSCKFYFSSIVGIIFASNEILKDEIASIPLLVFPISLCFCRHHLKKSIFCDLNISSRSIRITFFICKIIHGSVRRVISSL